MSYLGLFLQWLVGFTLLYFIAMHAESHVLRIAACIWAVVLTLMYLFKLYVMIKRKRALERGE